MIDSTLKKSNILIVDDEIANVDVLEGFLMMQGYENIQMTTDPRNVLPLFASFQPDLILLDLMMPYLSGFEVMNQLNAIHSGFSYVPILVLTADITTAVKQQALSGGATDFLNKPLDLIEVGLRIKNLLFTSFLQQELRRHNGILEVKVKERTSELLQKNQELVLAKEKAEASDRLKSTFINNISHEIRTPLNGILGFGQILAEPDLSEEEKQDYLNLLNESSNRLIHTVTNFMDISLLNSGNYEFIKQEVHLLKVIDQVIFDFSKTCSAKGLVFSTNGKSLSEELTISTDREILAKIIFHLVDNAVKFTKEGKIHLEYRIIDKDFHFSVSDTGIGISDECKEEIYKSFMQEDGQNTRGFEGSGLGLSIVKYFISLLGGKIWFESEKGVGSTFYFVLPDAAVDKALPIKNEGNKKAKHVILIAEDDDINFHYLMIILKDQKLDLVRAINGKEAVEICQRNENIDLVLMDLKMPEMDGFEATKRIKSIRADLPVIIVTAFAGYEEKQKAVESGGSDYLVKPVRKESLFQKLGEIGIFLG